MINLPGFILTDQLYEGSRAVLYRGHREADQKKVVVKILKSEFPSPDLIARFKHEYHLLSELKGSGTVAVYGFEKIGNFFVIVMEDWGSCSLDHMLLEKRIFDLAPFFKISLSIVDALEALHTHHIIHGEMSPSNILWDTVTQRAKIIDFGQASTLLRKEAGRSNLKKLEHILPYISPEQTGRMNRSIDYRTDFYSLGIIFYEMLTGQHPFQAQDSLELVHCHLVKIPELISKINPKIPLIVSAVIAKLLSKTAEDRYVSAAGLKADLLECEIRWKHNRHTESFTLGEQDIHDHLISSQKLYGRENQVSQLLQAFEDVSQGCTKTILISGYSGIGKTSLIREIYKPVTKQRGYFISGKYEQLKRTTPYSAFIEAFQELMQHILTESEQRLGEIKENLLKVLGNNAQVIIEMIPDLVLIIGPQPSLTTLPPEAVQSRFVTTFQNFMKVLAQPAHPLVLFLDDLQWIDSASLDLLKLLLMDKELNYLFLIGAYRDNEVTADHPFMIMQDQLKKMGCLFEHIALAPLLKNDVQNLLKDSLSADQKKIVELANLLMEKTSGNPFFINEFLKKIYQDGLLVFSYQMHGWQWDIEKIKRETITENVVDLLISRISKLPENTQRVLKFSACIGHIFDLKTVSIISGLSLQEAAKLLFESVQASFIMPMSEDYQWAEGEESNDILLSAPEKIYYHFVHDRIQQAAYQLIPQNKKQEIHLNIGRLMLKKKSLDEKDEKLFDIMNHFNSSLLLITDASEKKQLAQYNLWAGKRAKLSTAYQAAKEYLESGIFLLKDFELKEKQDIFFELSKELAVSQYLTGELEKAEVNFQKLLKQAQETLSSLEVYELNCAMLITLRRAREAVQLGLRALHSVNIYISPHPSIFTVLKNILKIQWTMRGKKIQETQLLPMTKKEYRAVLNLITELFFAANNVDRNLVGVLVCICVQISLRYGFTEDTALSLIAYASFLIHKFGSYKKGMEFVDLAYQIIQKNPNNVKKGKVYFLLSVVIEPWRLPPEKCFNIITQAIQACIEEGERQYAFCSYYAAATLNFISGKPVSEARKYCDYALNFIEKNKIEVNKEGAEFFSSLLQYLELPNKFDKKYIETHEKILLSDNLDIEKNSYYMFITKIYFLLDFFEEAQGTGSKQKYYFKKSAGGLINAEGRFYYALAIAATDAVKKKSPLKVFNKIRMEFERWTSWCLDNFQHYLFLLEAEQARIEGKTVLAMQRYEKAIKAAERKNALHVMANANECAGRFYYQLGLLEIAKLYFEAAYYHYRAWGAGAKCQLLEEKYPGWFQQMTTLNIKTDEISLNSSKAELSSIDVMSLLKSTRIISEEMQLDKLLKKLLVILLQNAGADRSVLIVKEGEHWYVEATGTVATQQVTLTHMEPIEEIVDLPLSLIRYVQRLKEPLLVQSPKDFEVFISKDPYLEEIKPQSTLTIPIIYQGQIKNILYLENKKVSQAFTPEHVHVLQVLSSQAAISLENARLYYQATHDPLTGLANRNLLYQTFNLVVHQLKRTDTVVAILFMDLDGFKKVNDTLGHGIGDKILLHFSQLLRSHVRDGDLPVRLGGDEFVVMLVNLGLSQVRQIAERITQKTQETVHIKGYEIHIGVSIGISFFPSDSTDIAELLRQADIALYRVKAGGKGYYQFYTKSLDQQIKEENKQEIELKNAIKRKELELYYQPVYSANTRELHHFEALLRWHHPTQGLLEANVFISLLEKSDLMTIVGEWIIKTVCCQIKNWIEAGWQPIPIAINISGVQFKNQTISQLVSKNLEETKVPVKYVELEFTESVFIDENEKILADINALKKLGVTLTLDDFGTYYSSLSYLRRFSLDKIKIDRGFIKNIETSEEDQSIVLAIIAMASSLKLGVVAEGVENEQQTIFLEKNRVLELQGNYLSIPLPASECVSLLRKYEKT